MASNFSFPVGHVTAGASNLSVVLGRSFRQPLGGMTTDPSTNHSTGWELWLNNASNGTAPDHANLFCMTKSLLSYETGGVVELSVHDSVHTSFGRVPCGFELPPRTIFYSNVNEASIITALTTLITDLRTANNTTDWVMQTVVETKQLHQHITDEVTGGTPESVVITNVVNDVIAGTLELWVKAGDLFGKADTAPSTLTPPAGATVDYKMVTIEITNTLKNKLNPSFYLWRWLVEAERSSNNFICITEYTLTDENIVNHPLTADEVLDIELNTQQHVYVTTNEIMPGQTVASNVKLIPIGHLATWHGANESAIEWRLTNDANLNFEVQLRTDDEGQPRANDIMMVGTTEKHIQLCNEPDDTNPIDVCPDGGTTAYYTNKPNTNWNRYDTDINDICEILDIPAELIIGKICLEAGTLGARACRLERVNSTLATTLKETYDDSIVDDYTNTVAGGLGSLIVPDPYPVANAPNDVIDSERGELKWSDLRTMMPGLRHRISPGLSQTLIETAFSSRSLSWIANLFNVATDFDVDAVPNSGAAHAAAQFDWLLDARQALVAGIAYVKFGYCNRASMLSQPQVGAAYNHGNLDQKIIDGELVEGNPWDLWFWGNDYPRETTRYYNRFQDRLAATTDPYTTLPTVRFWRNA